MKGTDRGKHWVKSQTFRFGIKVVLITVLSNFHAECDFSSLWFSNKLLIQAHLPVLCEFRLQYDFNAKNRVLTETYWQLQLRFETQLK